MRPGDLIDYEGARYYVLRLDSGTRLAILLGRDGGMREVPDTLDQDEPETCKLFAHPPDWPMVACPSKKLTTGPLIKVAVPAGLASRGRELRPWEDWMQADPLRAGGPLFFNPALGLRPGEVLIGTFRNGSLGRITIPNGFGTVAERVARAQAPGPEAKPLPQPVSRFTREADDIVGDD
jgi:hypothetical protein